MQGEPVKLAVTQNANLQGVSSQFHVHQVIEHHTFPSCTICSTPFSLTIQENKHGNQRQKEPEEMATGIKIQLLTTAKWDCPIIADLNAINGAQDIMRAKN